GGEALSLAAAKATIKELRDKNVPGRLAEYGKSLKEGYNAVSRELGMSYTTCSGFDCRTAVTFNPPTGSPIELKSLLQQEMIKRGVLWNGFHNMSFSHSRQDIAYTLNAYRDSLPIVKRALEANDVRAYLHGEPVEPIFRPTINAASEWVSRNAVRD